MITTAISEAQESQRQKSMAFSQRPSYDDLVKAGKVEEAKEGQKLAVKYYAVERRIEFCEDHLGLLSTVATLIIYTAL